MQLLVARIRVSVGILSLFALFFVFLNYSLKLMKIEENGLLLVYVPNKTHFLSLTFYLIMIEANQLYSQAQKLF
jgi:hypothetical protein